MDFAFNLGCDTGRLAIKMCIAASTILPEFEVEEVQSASRTLRSDATKIEEAKRLFVTVDAIDSARSPLSHVIYVERCSRGLYGIVQFFGTFQAYCLLGQQQSGDPTALLATLDPSTGKEVFTVTSPLGIREPAPFNWPIEQERGVSSWTEKLMQQMILLGASGVTLEGKMKRASSQVFHTLWETSTSTLGLKFGFRTSSTTKRSEN